MKIILRETYEGLGAPGDVVEVAGGYARNYLVPQGIAYPKNRFYEKRFQSEREDLLRRDALARARAEETAGQAAGVELEFIVKIGDRGKMFGAITNADIAKGLAEKGVEVERRKIQLKEPIKTTGAYEIPVKLHGEVGFTVKLQVIPEAPPEDELDDEELAALEAERAAAAEAEAEADEFAEAGSIVELVPVSSGDDAVVEEPVSEDTEAEAAEEADKSEE